MSTSWSMLVAGEVFDAAAREFLRVFLRSLAAAVAQGGLASSVPWAEISGGKLGKSRFVKL